MVVSTMLFSLPGQESHFAQRPNGHLRREDDRAGVGPTDGTDIGEGERAARQVLAKIIPTLTFYKDPDPPSHTVPYR